MLTLRDSLNKEIARRRSSNSALSQSVGQTHKLVSLNTSRIQRQRLPAPSQVPTILIDIGVPPQQRTLPSPRSNERTGGVSLFTTPKRVGRHGRGEQIESNSHHSQNRPYSAPTPLRLRFSASRTGGINNTNTPSNSRPNSARQNRLRIKPLHIDIPDSGTGTTHMLGVNAVAPPHIPSPPPLPFAAPAPPPPLPSPTRSPPQLPLPSPTRALPSSSSSSSSSSSKSPLSSQTYAFPSAPQRQLPARPTGRSTSSRSLVSPNFLQSLENVMAVKSSHAVAGTLPSSHRSMPQVLSKAPVTPNSLAHSGTSTSFAKRAPSPPGTQPPGYTQRPGPRPPSARRPRMRTRMTPSPSPSPGMGMVVVVACLLFTFRRFCVKSMRPFRVHLNFSLASYLFLCH